MFDKGGGYGEAGGGTGADPETVDGQLMLSDLPEPPIALSDIGPIPPPPMFSSPSPQRHHHHSPHPQAQLSDCKFLYPSK